MSPLVGFASSTLSIGTADCLWAPGNTADRRSCGPKTAEYRQWTRGSHLAPTGRSLRPRALKRSCPPHRGQRAQRSPSVPQTAAQHLWAASSSTLQFSWTRGSHLAATGFAKETGAPSMVVSPSGVCELSALHRCRRVPVGTWEHVRAPRWGCRSGEPVWDTGSLNLHPHRGCIEQICARFPSVTGRGGGISLISNP